MTIYIRPRMTGDDTPVEKTLLPHVLHLGNKRDHTDDKSVGFLQGLCRSGTERSTCASDYTRIGILVTIVQVFR